MLVKEIITKNVVTIDSNKSVYDSAYLLREHKIGSVIVTNNTNDIMGIVTKRDIIGGTILMHKNAETTHVTDVMTTNIITIHPLEKIEKALDIMDANKIKKLLVIKDDVIVGVITVTDISKAAPERVNRFMDACLNMRNE